MMEACDRSVISFADRPGRRPRILITGFGPFPGTPYNASSALVQLAASEPVRGSVPAAIQCRLLPTAWNTAPAQAMELVTVSRPDAVVHFGVSSRATGFQLETRAYNAVKNAVDCEGCRPAGPYLRRGAPPFLDSTFPTREILRALRQAGLPASLSTDPGRYLCNAVLYSALLAASPMRSPPLVGFVHIPALPPPHIADPKTKSLRREWAQMQDGLVIMLRILANVLRLRRQQPRRPGSNRLRTAGRGRIIA
jgi:pyroglutamyl-peptidase